MSSENNNFLNVMPFYNLTDYNMINEFVSAKQKIKQLMEYNGLDQFMKKMRIDELFNYDENIECHYYDEDMMKKLCINGPESLNVFSLNVRSLPKHGGELLCLLDSLEARFQLIILTEIGARNLGLVENLIPGHTLLHVIPKSNMKGGVGIYCSNDLIDLSREDELVISKTCKCDVCDFESLVVNFNFGGKPYTVVGIYRHPNGNVSHFVHDLEGLISKLDKKRTWIIAGDININIINHEGSNELTYLTMLLSYKFLPYIIVPSRITQVTATCIDHIFLRKSNHDMLINITSGLIFNDLSDHLPCFISLKNEIKHGKNRPFTRLFGDKNSQQFVQKMTDLYWDGLYTDVIPDWFTAFIMKVKLLFDSSFPIVRVSRKRSHDRPWISSGLKISIKRNHKLYRDSLIGSQHVISKYKSYNKILRRSIKIAESNYFRELFDNSKNSVIKLWKSLGNFINTSGKKSKTRIDKIMCNGKYITDPQSISNVMNNYFCNIGKSLQDNIPPTGPDEFKNYLPPAIVNSFFLRPIEVDEIINLINKLNPRKSSGPDGISGKLLKLCPQIFAYNMKIIFNKAIETGEYPCEMKIAKVIALFKKGNKYISNNYRPISLLSIFDKIFEKLICKQLLSFMEKNKILYDFQFGFRKNHSTSLAMIETTDSIRRLIDDKNYVLGIFVDLTKAFDTVDHDILLEKMNNYGIRGHANNFFRSFLTNRKQFSCINGIDSSLLNINCGVPQGSVLGPILFLIYINDLHRALPDCKVRLFADDTGIFINNTDFETLTVQSKYILEKLFLWCNHNKLIVNSDKTCFIVFHANNKNAHRNFTEIKIQDNTIARVSSTKYLGIIFDEKLTWKEHVNYICNSLLKYFGIFNHIKSFIDKSVVRQLYFSFIYSRISYGIEVFANDFKKHAVRLQIIQNKLLKLVLRMDRMTPTNTLHAHLQLLKITDIYKVKVIVFVNNILLGKCPDVFNDYFVMNEPSYNLRHTGLTVHRTRTRLGSLGVYITGAQLWNGLPDTIKQFRFQANFKKLLTKHYINDYNDL